MLGLSTVWIPKLHCILTSFVHKRTQCFVQISIWKITAAHNLENASSFRVDSKIQLWKYKIQWGRMEGGKQKWPYCSTGRQWKELRLNRSHSETLFNFCCILTFFVHKRTQCFVQIMIWKQTANYWWAEMEGGLVTLLLSQPLEATTEQLTLTISLRVR